MAGPNPNPTFITEAEWTLWLECEKWIPGVRLSGIYANKSCYHNTVVANKKNWPNAYCIKVPLDLKGTTTKARAIDLTMSDVEMRKRTGYLKAAALDPRDDRLNCIREFIGTIDSKNVICYMHDDYNQDFRFSAGRDSTHLWHIHISFFTFYCETWENELEAVHSVLIGETYDAWLQRKDGSMIQGMLCQQGDNGTIVKAFQRCLLEAGHDLGQFGADGQWGSTTTAAAKQFFNSLGWMSDGTAFLEGEWPVFLKGMVQLFAPKDTNPPQPPTVAPHTHDFTISFNGVTGEAKATQ